MYTCIGGSCRAQVFMRLSKKFTSPCVAEEELCRLDQENQPANDPLAGCGYSPINIEHVSHTPTIHLSPVNISTSDLLFDEIMSLSSEEQLQLVCDVFNCVTFLHYVA